MHICYILSKSSNVTQHPYNRIRSYFTDFHVHQSINKRQLSTNTCNWRCLSIQKYHYHFCLILINVCEYHKCCCSLVAEEQLKLIAPRIIRSPHAQCYNLEKTPNTDICYINKSHTILCDTRSSQLVRCRR